MTEQKTSETNTSEQTYQTKLLTLANILGMTHRWYSPSNDLVGFFANACDSAKEQLAENARRQNYEKTTSHNVCKGKLTKHSFPTLEGEVACQHSLAQLALKHEDISPKEYIRIRQDVDLLAVLYQTQGRPLSSIENPRQFHTVLSRIEHRRDQYNSY